MGARAKVGARWWGGSWRRRPPYTYARENDLVYTRIEPCGSVFADHLFWQLYRESLERVSFHAVITNIEV